ncbi:MAG: DUF4139 domain-containing protein [Phycisphaerales bacterium]|nr:DUF4139 domain-containing protein [Phycisphaerales bacterium]
MRTLGLGLALTLAAGLCCSMVAVRHAAASEAIENRAERAADRSLPVTRITLYRSGVASFERRGRVSGDADVKLKFDNAQVNDVLKSLVAVDLSGKGQVRGVSYGSSMPLSRRLESFGINLGDEPSMASLLGRLRGAEVRVGLPEGMINGTILGSEVREQAVGNAQKTVSVPYLNVVTAKGIRSVSLHEARSVELVDAGLQAELTKALTAIATQREERTRSVDVGFGGTGDREVAVIYTHEAPVWKVSYRVLLSTEKPTKLSGWAIVENTTDDDWTDVRLSLVSGRPVSFSMDLQEPLFAQRPWLAVPSVGGMAPRVYAEAMEAKDANGLQAMNQVGRVLSKANSGQSVDAKREADRLSAFRSASPASAPAEIARDGAVASPFTPESIGQASASASLSGEVFHYDVSTPTTIARQSSAMIPIVGSDIKTRRVSILSPGNSGQTRYPMRGMELTNSTDLQLLPGPIAVYDEGVYAGDSMIEQIGPGDTRLLSYATDLDVVVVSEESGSSTVRKVRIVNGVFEQRTNAVQTTTYKLRNKSEKIERLLIIEHPKLGTYKLAKDLKPVSETASLYRFEKELKPGERTDFVVTQETEGLTTVAFDNFDERDVLAWQQSGKLSPAALEAFREVGKRKGEIKSLERRKADLDAEWKRITDDQDRTRKNMGSIDRNSELYDRYMKKLGEQETQGEKIGAENIELTEKLRKLQEDLSKYLSQLNVE